MKIPSLTEITTGQTIIYGTIAVATGWTGYTIHRAAHTLKRLEQRDRFERGKK